MITHSERSILGPIPDEWETIQLRKCLSASTAGDWGDDYGEVMLSVLRSTNFTNSRQLDLTNVAVRGFSCRDAEKFNLISGDILVERSGGGPGQPVGRVVTIEQDTPNAAFSNFVQLLRVDKEIMDPDFVGWCLYRLHESGVIERFQHQTTQMRNLDYRDYLRLELPKPRLEEQRLIAGSIASVDKAIRCIRVELDAAQRLKRSLVQQLYAKGLPGSHRHFRESKVGLIPESWDCVRLKCLVESIDAGSSPQCEATPARQGYWGVLKVSAVSWDEFDENENKELPADLEPDLKAEVKIGDIIVSRANTAGLAGAAQRVRRLNHKLLLCDKTWRLTPRRDIDHEWFLGLLKSPRSRQQIESIATGTSDTMKNISQRDFMRLWVPLPKETERQDMARLLQKSDESIDAIRIRLYCTERLKRSILQHLLTGKIRAQGAIHV